MKKLIITVLSCILICVGCVDQVASENTAAQVSYTLPTIRPQTELPLPTPSPTIDLNADPMDVVATILQDAQIIFAEDQLALSQNEAGNSDDGVIRNLSDDGESYEIISTQAEVWVNFGKSLRDYESNKDEFNRAWLFKFMPVACENFQIVVWGASDYWLQFDDTGYPAFSGLDYEFPNYCFAEFPQTFRLEQNKWYYCLIAFDDETNCRFVLWEEGQAEDLGYYARKLHSDEAVAKEHTAGEMPNWSLAFQLSKDATLKIAQYWVLDFGELLK